jgi:4-carboxymuconolactone decarboxylase
MRVCRGAFLVIVFGVLFCLMGCATMQKGDERVRLKEPRIKPLPESQANAEAMKLINSRRKPDGTVMNLYTTLANHPKMGERWLTFASYILRESTLPARDREILILRIGWLCRSEYEFAQHTRVGKSAGLKDEEIKRITLGANASGWDPFDATLIRAADELHADAFITDATWNALAKRYNQQQLMDVVMTVGNYNLVSMLLNTFGVQLESGVAGFPK